MNIPHADERNDHPDKLYRVHVRSYGPPSAEAFEYFESNVSGEEFYYPVAHRTYRSLSAAQSRASLLRFNGADAVVIAASPEWRLHETKDEKIARLEAEVAEMKRF